MKRIHRKVFGKVQDALFDQDILQHRQVSSLAMSLMSYTLATWHTCNLAVPLDAHLANFRMTLQALQACKGADDNTKQASSAR